MANDSRREKPGKRLSNSEIVSRVSKAVQDAVGFSKENIATKQELGLKLYKREPFEHDEKLIGRNRYQSADVRERSRWFQAQMVRMFDSQNRVVEFVPQNAEDELLAIQQTDVVNAIVRTHNSHVASLGPWLLNGFITGLGIVTVDFVNDTGWKTPVMLEGVGAEQLIALTQAEDAGDLKIVESGEPYIQPAPPEMVQQVEAMAQQQGIPLELAMTMLPQIELRDLKIRYSRRNTRRVVINNVAPEDFIVSADADFCAQTGGIKARLQGHKRVIARSELLEREYDPKLIAKIPSAHDSTDAMAIQRRDATDGDQGVGDVEDDVILYEIFTRIDVDGDGWREYVRLTLAGDIANKPVLLAVREVSEYAPYAAFCPFPLPNTLFGHGIADFVGDEQHLMSNIIRAILDNLGQHVNPMKVVNPDAVNMSDLLNPHAGKLVRTTGDPSAGVSFVTTPFTAMNALPVLELIKQNMDHDTGVGGSMMGVDASTMQNTTATAISQSANASQLLVELCGRIFADTGYRYMFRLIVDALVQDPEGAKKLIVRLHNDYVPIESDAWNADLDITATVAFGMTNKDFQNAFLQNMYAQQMAAIQAGQPIANAQNLYNLQIRIAENGGIKNASALWTDPSTLPPRAPMETPPDPNMLLLQLEQLKADREHERAMLKIRLDNDLARDKMQQDAVLKAAEIESKGATAINMEALWAAQQMRRDDVELAQAAEKQRIEALQAAQAQAQQLPPQQP